MAHFTKTNFELGIARATLSRPDLHNAFNEVMIAEITEAFRELGKRDDVRVIVLAGEGKSFCAGADINWMKKMVSYTFDENVKDADAMATMLRTIRECPKPVIARVHGAAFGGGVGLTAACDIAVALESAVFCLSEVKLGIIPAVISPYVLEKIGAGEMRRYGLTAEKISASEARRIGLIHEVFATETDMDAWIESTCELLQSNGPNALAAAKQIFTEVEGVPWDDVQKRTTRKIAELRASREGQEGLKSFLEKRKPNWVTGESRD
ncbi:MAG: enoyl-CoA hydratase/isomerase family protein [Planctomycetes bacterium]|nr:enoyl-CoA hydratase/isomerase family protein [Planctomycetota bacterium]MBI3834184.1 enoyl-CoA hydratase/isomerase family protein [Planctomycetota bacterium]